LGDFGIETVHGLYAEQTVVLFIIFRLADLAGDHVTRAQAKAPNLGLGNVDVGRTWKKAVFAEESVAIFDDLEDATAKEIPLLLSLGLEDSEDKLLLLQRAVTGHTEVAGHVL